MILRTRCPSCGTAYRLQAPLPPEGKKYRCTCKTVITIAYPPEVREALATRGMSVPRSSGELDEEAPTQQMAALESAPAKAPPAQPRKAVPAPATDVEQPTANLSPANPRSMGPEGPGLAPGELGLEGSSRSSRALSRRVRSSGEMPTETMDAGTLKQLVGLGGSEEFPLSEDEPDDTTGFVATEPSAPAQSHLAAPASGKQADAAGPDGQARPVEERQEEEIGPPAPKPGFGAFRRGRSTGPMRLLKIAGLTIVALGCAGIASVAGVFWHYGKGLPSVDTLAVYEPPVVTTVRDVEGRVIGEFFEEQRYVASMEQIPEHLKNAFVAAEDASFWEHKGLDYMGIVRAMIKNIQERRMAQGASTITQQVARSFLLTREKKLKRKIREAILAGRIERNFEKDYILYLYLNQIFLGHGAYGVQAAAKLYFDKDVSQLTIPEAAIIAGLPQAPSKYSPNRNFRAAKDRQRYVLGQMARRGYVTEEEAEAAYKEELVFSKKRDRNLDIAPFYVEHVRRYLVKTYGHEATYTGGLQVEVPLNVELQLAANEAVGKGVRRADKRIGYRGPKRKLKEGEERNGALIAIDRERTLRLRPYDPAFELPEGAVDPELIPRATEGELSRGVVARVEKTWALVDMGSVRGILPVKEFSWCHNVKPDVDWRYFNCRRLDDMMAVGDEIELRVVQAEETWERTLPKEFEGPRVMPRFAMEQAPAPEGALLSMRLSDGAILAMVGGSSFVGSEFNRAVQAKRQVGSTFKPLVYAAALDYAEPKKGKRRKKDAPILPEDRVFNLSSILVDSPIVEELSGKEGELWKPGNSGGKYLGDTTFRRGLILSRNIVTLKILNRLGIRYTLDYMKRFGFDTPLEENLAMGLGASALTMHEMVRAYSAFPTLGDRREPLYIREVKDRNGKVLERTEEGALEEEVLSEETAYLLVNLMSDVVRAGTAQKARELGKPVAGKTGTTNQFRDAWFIGYTPEVLTAVWVGLDEFQTMGKAQYGGELALPIWMEYMKEALERWEPSEYEKPEEIDFFKIDSLTGLLAREGEPAQKVPFLKGTEPTRFAPTTDQVDAADFLSGEF